MQKPINAHWKCHRCLKEVQPDFVKYDETHDGCGGQCEWIEGEQFTTSPADAAAVRKKCLEKLSDLGRTVEVWMNLRRFWIACGEYRADAETEELCWCLFARQLYTEEKR